MGVPLNHPLIAGIFMDFPHVTHQPAGSPGDLFIASHYRHDMSRPRLTVARHFGSRQEPGPRTLAGEPCGQALMEVLMV